jgi:hypothetical protein
MMSVVSTQLLFRCLRKQWILSSLVLRKVPSGHKPMENMINRPNLINRPYLWNFSMRRHIIFFCYLSIIFSISSTSALAEISEGVVQLHPANEDIIYNWFSYVPESIEKSEKVFILVSVTGGLFDYAENTEQVRLYTENIKYLSESYKFILLTPSIPRTNTPTDIYTVAFDRQCFLSKTDPMYTRPDLKVNQMIVNLTNELESNGYVVNEKVFVEGFSAGGMFAQRYCLIHPTKVQAIAAGQCGGSLTLPVSQYGGTALPWAIGIGDLRTLVGFGFNNFVYRQVPQYIYIGENDTENSHFKWPNPDGFWTQDQIDFIDNLFGKTDPVRVENMAGFMKNIGCNVTFQLYENTGHEIMPWNTPGIYADIYSFFSQNENFEVKESNANTSILNLLLGN